MELLDFDDLTGIATYHEYNPLTDETHIHTIQDVEPILEANKALYTADDGYGPTREWRRCANIPNALIHKWMVEDGIDVYDNNDWPAVQRKLNSNEYLFLRTAPGHLGHKVGR